MDEIDWDRVEAKDDSRFPQTDHTTGTREGEEYEGFYAFRVVFLHLCFR